METRGETARALVSRASNVAEYPDSNKIGIRIGEGMEKPVLRVLFRAEQNVDYWDREF